MSRTGRSPPARSKSGAKLRLKRKRKARRRHRTVHPAGTLTQKTLAWFAFPPSLSVASVAQFTPNPDRRATILQNLTQCFYRLLEPAQPEVSEQTDLNDLF